MTSDTEEFLDDDLEELSSAEDFLEYFRIPFDSKVVHINRLHIMQRFHDYLQTGDEAMDSCTGNDKARAEVYRVLLQKAYEDFVESDALTEKVFKVFKMQGPQTTFVSAESIFEN